MAGFRIPGATGAEVSAPAPYGAGCVAGFAPGPIVEIAAASGASRLHGSGLQLSAQEQASFDGRHRVIRLIGPLTLLRLCGKTASGAASDPYGRYWFNEKFFWNMIDLVSDHAASTVQLNHYLRFVLREFTAVCRDWNNFASIYQFSLPAGASVEVAVGRIAPQPFHSAADPQRRMASSHEVFVGGEFQYIVDMAANPWLKRHVQGPRPLTVHRAGNA